MGSDINHDNYQYDILFRDDCHFKSTCNKIEEEIVKQNLFINGGTLNFNNLTYRSDILVVCFKENELIGFNSLMLNRDNLYIIQIGIKNEHKKKGIGTQMMKIAISIAQRFNLKVSAHVRDYNIASQNMINRLGFEKMPFNGSPNNPFYVLDNSLKMDDDISNKVIKKVINKLNNS